MPVESETGPLVKARRVCLRTATLHVGIGSRKVDCRGQD